MQPDLEWSSRHRKAEHTTLNLRKMYQESTDRFLRTFEPSMNWKGEPRLSNWK